MIIETVDCYQSSCNVNDNKFSVALGGVQWAWLIETIQGGCKKDSTTITIVAQIKSELSKWNKKKQNR